MAIDIVDLRSFYATPLGAVARRLIARAIRKLWPNIKGQSLAGIGYATPCLAPFRAEAASVIALMPAAQGVVNWPGDGLSATALVLPDELPLPNASIDRVLLLHAIETMTNPLELLNEVWRVLSPGGRIIAVVPNRRGFWARRDMTPFGHGQPFSRTQLAQLMRIALFSPEHWAEALHLFPSQRRMLLRSANVVEKLGEKLSLPFYGVHVVEATKQLYRPATASKSRRGFTIAAPQPVAPRKGCG
jgi:SAM-dependent methyltransferase